MGLFLKAIYTERKRFQSEAPTNPTGRLKQKAGGLPMKCKASALQLKYAPHALQNRGAMKIFYTALGFIVFWLWAFDLLFWKINKVALLNYENELIRGRAQALPLNF